LYLTLRTPQTWALVHLSTAIWLHKSKNSMTEYLWRALEWDAYNPYA
jgi:hypothetical protein